MRVSIVYTGRVQGVGFRATARSIVLARPPGERLTGWVRNAHDGSVEMQLQGERSVVDGVLEELERAMARNISHVDRTVMPEQPGEAGFVIAR